MENIFGRFEEDFWYGEPDMTKLLNRPYRSSGGFLMFCTGGKAVMMLGIQELEIIQNGELMVLPGSTFYLTRVSEDFTVRIFTFSKSLYDEVSLRLGVSFPQYLREIPYYLYPENDPFLSKAYLWLDMAKLVYEHENQEDFKSIMQWNFLQSYLLYLYAGCQLYFRHTVGVYTRKQEQFQQFLSLLDTYCYEHRDVEFYADKLCITSRYLREITKAYTSFESPKDVIDKRLILEAKVLLQYPDYTIQEISEKLHFPDQSYFGRYFKRHTGISPSDYRHQIEATFLK